VIAGHVAAVAILMSTKLDLPERIRDFRTVVTFVPAKPPQRVDSVKQPRPQSQPRYASPDPIAPIPTEPDVTADPDPTPAFPLPTGPVGPVVDPLPSQPVPATPAVLLTGLGELRPPYPAAKLASGEEAVLKLRLTVDQGGRVVAVEPIGRADRTFLEAARRHIIAHWRYRPASRDGHDVMATLVVTLRFQLDD